MVQSRKKLRTRLPSHERKLKKFLRGPGFSPEVLFSKVGGDVRQNSIFDAEIKSVSEASLALSCRDGETILEATLSKDECARPSISDYTTGNFVRVTLRKDGEQWIASEIEAFQLEAYATIPKEGSEQKVPGVFLSRAGNGYSVALNTNSAENMNTYKTIRAYAPMRHAVHERDIRLNPDLHGQSDEFIIHEGVVEQDNLIVSRRAALKEQHKAREAALWQNIEVGQRVRGVVKNLTRYGAFIDIGGVDGLLHQTDLSWSGRARVEEVLKKGERIETQIIELDQNAGKIKLGLKQLLPDPFNDPTRALAAGSIVKGRVVSLTDYGAFIEIADGLEGLAHISELSWSNVKHPSNLLQIGQTVEAKILELDQNERRLSLSLKATQQNPYAQFESETPAGSVVEAMVTSLTDFGAFVKLTDHIEGLIHLGEFSWTKRIEHADECVSVGDTINVKIIDINTADERVSCSIKRLEDDPTDAWRQKYAVGQRLNLVITQLTEGGAQVELEDEHLEGFIKKRELASEPVNRVIDVVKVGDEVECEVLELNARQQTVYLSIRRAQEQDTKAAYEDYKNKEGEQSTGFSIADALSDSAKEKLNVE